jgi:hypothetical protein
MDVEMSSIVEGKGLWCIYLSGYNLSHIIVEWIMTKSSFKVKRAIVPLEGRRMIDIVIINFLFSKPIAIDNNISHDL